MRKVAVVLALVLVLMFALPVRAHAWGCRSCGGFAGGFISSFGVEEFGAIPFGYGGSFGFAEARPFGCGARFGGFGYGGARFGGAASFSRGFAPIQFRGRVRIRGRFAGGF